ncbi:phage/plasmid primase, P4 family [Nocardioides daphniae]|nr:phage/plasmid primase, P4 family [Nocardioides daphniae]GGD15494.1 hypothetical protein GCM10007231_13130 [Nocardioides daphniae]
MTNGNGIPPTASGVPADVLWVVQKIGWPVFPVYEIERGRCACGKIDCKSPGKHPRSQNGVGDATTDMTKIETWAARFPQANWAASPVGGVVVDIDPRNGGFDSMGEWDVSLPHTTTVLTGGGGKHLYFLLPEGVTVGNRNNWLPGVDAKTVGGYVLLPGSNHTSGGVYQWQTQCEPVPAPDGLIAALRERKGLGLPGTDVLLDGVPDGQRDDMIFRACCRWWRQFRHHEDNGLSAVTARALEMGRRCEPPFSDKEIATKVKSAARYALEEPRFRHTDDGNAQLYAEQHAGSLKFTNDSKTWFAWDGRRWVRDADLTALHRARLTARSLVDYAMDLNSEDAGRGAAIGWARTSLNSGRIKAMPELAKSDERIHAKNADFDARPDLLNTPTGVVDLRTGKLLPHDRDQLHSKMTTVGYDPDASTEWWESFVHWAMVGRPDLIEFLQRSVGYALTGETSEQAIWLHHGGGANGKSTFVEAISGVIGDYAATADPELLTGGHTTGLADLHGKRFVALSEVKEGAKVDEQRFKMLSGEDKIKARFLYKDFFEFKSTATIFWAMNHLPKIGDDTYGMWRRIFAMPWDATLPREQQKKGVADWAIKTHGAGILKWAVQGAVEWYASGLVVPADVQRKTEAYKNREDTMSSFYAEHFVKEVDAKMPATDVVAAYNSWCRSEGVTDKERLGSTTVKRKFEERLGLERKRIMIDGQKVAGYEGYRAVGLDAVRSWS